jgi:hypothetical protein
MNVVQATPPELVGQDGVGAGQIAAGPPGELGHLDGHGRKLR